MNRKILLVILLLMLAVNSNAQVISGRLFTSFYTWEREVFGFESTKHVQSYNGAILHIRQLGHKDVSFHTYVRTANSIAGSDLKLEHKLYNAYLEWQKILGRGYVSVGRQYIWAGVGNGTLDGAKAEADFRKWGKIGGYAGTLAPLRESWKIDSWASSKLIGAYYKVRFYDANIHLSWAKKSRKRVEYKVPGQYTLQKLSSSAVMANLAGLDISRGFSEKLTVFARTEGTLNSAFENFNIDRVEVSADYLPSSKITFTGQYFYRRPRMNLNSIFSIFSQSYNREIWFNAYYRPSTTYSVYGGYARVMFDNENTNRFNAGFSLKYLSIGVQKHTGYSGNLDNMFLSYQHELKPNLWAKGVLSAGRYKLYEDATDYNNLVTSSIGFTFQPRPSMTFDIEGQGLRNVTSSTDFRLFGRFNYWFFRSNK